MSSTKEIKAAPKKAKSPSKFDNSSIGLKRIHKKKVKTQDTTSQALSALKIVKNYTYSTGEKIFL